MSNISIDLKQLGITWDDDTEYNVVLDFDFVRSNTTPAIPNETLTLFQFTNNEAGADIIENMIARTYDGNTGNQLFELDTPQIIQFDVNNPTYTITLSSSLGKFATNDNSAALTNWNYTGTKEEINNIFSNIMFYPNLGTTSNGTFTYTQQRESETPVSFTIDLNYSGTTETFTPSTYTFTSNGTFTPSNIDIEYSSNIQVLLVGGGGGGADGVNGGGGAGGDVLEYSSLSLTSGTSYPIIVGNGGNPGNEDYDVYPKNSIGQTGGTTSAFGYSAIGGTGGQINVSLSGSTYTYDNPGGNSASYTGGQHSGSTTSFNGALLNAGGGGAGAGGNGVDASSTANGGIGVYSSIMSDTYGGGGGGIRTTGTFGNGTDGGGDPYSGIPATNGGGGGTGRAGANGIVVIKVS